MKNNIDKIELFEKTPVQKAVMIIAWPTIFATIAAVIYNLTDQFFVGNLNNADQSAAVTLSGNITLLFIAVENIFGIGGSSIMGRALGKHQYQLAMKSTSFCFWALIATSILFSVLFEIFKHPIMMLVGANESNINYTFDFMFYACTLGALPTILNVVLAFFLRTEGDSFHATIGTILGCVLNVILNIFLVLPQFFNLGIIGSGIATLFSNIASCAYMIVWIKIKKSNTCINFSIKNALPNKLILKEVFLVGIPAALQNLFNVIGMSILNNFASAFGSSAVAAMGISYKIYMMPMLIATALSQSAMPVISYNYGAKKHKRLIDTIKFAFVATIIWIVIMAVVVCIFSREFMLIFIKLDDVVEIGEKLLRYLSFGLPFLAFDFLVVGICQSCGKGGKTLFFAIMRKVIFEIPLLFMLNYIYPLYGLALAAPIAEFLMSIITGIVLCVFIKKLGYNNNETN